MNVKNNFVKHAHMYYVLPCNLCVIIISIDIDILTKYHGYVSNMEGYMLS